VSRYAMEGRGPRGFGWEYPPGASGSASPVRARCEKCGEEAEVVVVRELGSTYTEPEGCAGCGGARPGKGGNKNAEGRRTGGDEDNLSKLAKDALSGVAYADDGQIARSIVEKLFVDQAGVDEPISIIEVRALLADAPALEVAA